MIKNIKKEIKAPKGMTKDVSFSGDSFDITFKYDDPVNDDIEAMVVKGFKANSEVLENNCRQAIGNLENQTDISGIVCRIHIFNSSGDEIWTGSYDSSGSTKKGDR